MYKIMNKILLLTLSMTILFVTTISTFAASMPLFIGDANSDGNVTITDVTYIQRYLADLTDLSKRQLLGADVDGNERVTIADATIIQRKLAGFREDFYRQMIYAVNPSIDNFCADYDSGLAMAGVPVTFLASAEGIVPLTYEFLVENEVVQERSASDRLEYVFETAGEYWVGVRAYNGFDEYEEYNVKYEVSEPYVADVPMIVAANFDHIVDRRTRSTISVYAIGGAAPYQYRYIITGNHIQNPFDSAFTVQTDNNGNQYLLKDFSDDSVVKLPNNDALKVGENYTLEITVKDADGTLSKPRIIKFNNEDIPR